MKLLFYKYLNIFVIFTIVTKTFVYWALFFSVKVYVITTLFFGLTLLVNFYFYQKKNLKLPQKWILLILFFTFFAPILVSSLTLKFNYNAILLNLLFLSIFILSIYNIKFYGNNFVRKVLTYAFFFNIAIGLFSVFSSDFFIPFSQLIETSLNKNNRATGFYLQPNGYAVAIIINFILLISVSEKLKNILILYPFALIMVVLSGSRGNIAAFAIISVVLFYFFVKNHKKNFLNSLLKFSPIFVILSIVFTSLIYTTLKTDKYENLYNRINYFSDIEDEDTMDDIENDASVASRLEYQKYYLLAILEKPILGYGIGENKHLMEKKILKGSSHNAFLQILLEGGLLYFLILLFFLFISFKLLLRKNKINPNKFTILAIYLFFMYLFIICFFTNTLFNNRFIYLALGIFAAQEAKYIKIPSRTKPF